MRTRLLTTLTVQICMKTKKKISSVKTIKWMNRNRAKKTKNLKILMIYQIFTNMRTMTKNKSKELESSEM
jgi:hypothetical protein